MTFNLFVKPQHPCLRLVASGLISLQTALLGVAIGEFVATQPQLSSASAAYAQGSKVQSAESAVIYIETNRGRGSGVVIDPTGLIVTNAHVVEDARKVFVTVRGRRMPAEVVSMGNANCLDLALLKIEGVRDLPALSLDNADPTYKTQTVYAIGYPGPLPGDSATITRGIISNIHPSQGTIQLDGSINPGNSGGAVVDDNANLIGIATSRLRGAESINFAVAANQVKAFVQAYRQGSTNVVGRAVMSGSDPDSGPLSSPISLDGREVQGSLQAGDSRFCGDASLAELYTFEAEAGQSIMLQMVSQVMGSYLALIGPDGTQIAQSDIRSRNESAIVLESLPQTGTYTVIANAAKPNQSGDYQLRATQPLLVETGMVHHNTAPCFERGQRCQSYQFLGQANQDLALFLHYAEFSPVVVLLGPSGQIVAGGRANSQDALTLSLAEDGWHNLLIATQEPEATGSFRVSLHDIQTLIPESFLAES